MKSLRWFKFFLLIILLLVLGMLCFIVPIYFFITPEKIQTKLTESALLNYGVTLQCQTPKIIQRLPKLIIEVPKLRYHNTSEKAQSIESVRFTLSPLSIFAKNPAIERLDIQAANLTFDINQSNQTAKHLNHRINQLSVEHSSFTFNDSGITVLTLNNTSIEASKISGSSIESLSTQASLYSDHFSGEVKTSSALFWDSNTQIVASYPKFEISSHQEPKLSFKGSLNQLLFFNGEFKLTDLFLKNTNETLQISSPLITIDRRHVAASSLSFKQLNLKQNKDPLSFLSTSWSYDLTSKNHDFKGLTIDVIHQQKTSQDKEHHLVQLFGEGNIIASTHQAKLNLSGAILGSPATLDLTKSKKQPYLVSMKLGDIYFDELSESFVFINSFDALKDNLLAKIKIDSLSFQDSPVLTNIESEISVNQESIELLNGVAYRNKAIFNFSGGSPSTNQWMIFVDEKNANLAQSPLHSLFANPNGELKTTLSGTLMPFKVLNTKGQFDLNDHVLQYISIDALKKELIEERSNELSDKIFSKDQCSSFSSLYFEFTCSDHSCFINNGQIIAPTWTILFSGDSGKSNTKLNVTLELAANVGLPNLVLKGALQNTSNAWLWSLDANQAAKSLDDKLGPPDFSLKTVKRKVEGYFDSLKEIIPSLP